MSDSVALEVGRRPKQTITSSEAVAAMLRCILGTHKPRSMAVCFLEGPNAVVAPAVG
jgi:hypothetical protein